MNTRSQIQNSLFYVFDFYHYLLKDLKKTSGFVEGKFSVDRFRNQELFLTIQDSCQDKSCIVFGTLMPPEINLISFLMLCHTLQKEKAKRITAVIPYLSYSRQDREEPKKSKSAALIGRLLATSGVDALITFDVHSMFVEKLIPIPLISLSPAFVFAEEIRKLAISDATIVSPDVGAINRAEDVAKELKNGNKVAYIEKKRTKDGVTHHELHNNVTEKVIIIDDILDTGKTLISCCEKLIEKGVKEIIIMVTHGLFTGKEWEKLWGLRVKKIYCTDTLPIAKELLLNKKISTLSVVPQLIEALIKKV